MYDERKENLLKELEKLHKRNGLSKSVGPAYFEPGMMEYLEQSEGLYDALTGEVLIRFESKGTRYDIKKVSKMLCVTSKIMVGQQDKLRIE